MNKAEIIEAINATIAPNNVKGITAESLANLLIEIVNAAGDGSGDGALRVIVPDTIIVGPEIVSSGELSPSSWAAFRAESEASLGVDLSEYEAVVNASFVHNAEVAQQILAKAREGKGVSVVLDCTPYSSVATEASMQLQPDLGAMVEEGIVGGVQPASLSVQYMKPTPEGVSEFGEESFTCQLVPTGYINDSDSGSINYSSDMIITLNLDGSLLFKVPESETESGS